MAPTPIKLYFDDESRFAYLAKAEAYTLEEDYWVTIEWLPYVLNIPEALNALPLALSVAAIAAKSKSRRVGL